MPNIVAIETIQDLVRTMFSGLDWCTYLIEKNPVKIPDIIVNRNTFRLSITILSTTKLL